MGAAPWRRYGYRVQEGRLYVLPGWTEVVREPRPGTTPTPDRPAAPYAQRLAERVRRRHVPPVDNARAYP